MVKRIVLLRHGESEWNRENRFTGWTDVDLSRKGTAEAYEAGRVLKERGFAFRMAFASRLKRAIKTMNCVLDAMDLDWIDVEKSWRLNEKHYGALQGLDKSETAAIYGQEQVRLWRRGYDTAPAPAERPDDVRYSKVPLCELPRTESLKDTVGRVIPYWECEIFPRLADMDDILVVAHGNSLRGIVKHLKNISDADIADLNIPTAIPYVFEFDGLTSELTDDYYIGDPEKIRELQQAVANQGCAK